MFLLSRCIILHIPSWHCVLEYKLVGLKPLDLLRLSLKLKFCNASSIRLNTYINYRYAIIAQLLLPIYPIK